MSWVMGRDAEEAQISLFYFQSDVCLPVDISRVVVELVVIFL